MTEVHDISGLMRRAGCASPTRLRVSNDAAVLVITLLLAGVVRGCGTQPAPLRAIGRRISAAWGAAGPRPFGAQPQQPSYERPVVFQGETRGTLQQGQGHEEDRALRLVQDTDPGSVRLASLDASPVRVPQSSELHPVPSTDPRRRLRLCDLDPLSVPAA